MTASSEHSLQLAHYLTTEPAIAHCLNVHATLRETAPEMSEVALTRAFQTFHLAAQEAKHLRKQAQHHSLLTQFELQLGNAASMLQSHLGHHQPTASGEPTYRHWTDYTVHAVRAQHLAALLDTEPHHHHHADIENACRSNLNTMHAISTRINPAENWTLHNPRITPEVKSILEEARRQYILAASFITVRRRQRLPSVIRPALAARTSIAQDLQRHITDFRRQTDDQSVMPMFHLDPPVVALIYTHDGVIYAQEPQENFAKGYPADQANLFAQQLVTLPTRRDYDPDTQPNPYLANMASFILDKTAARTHDVSDHDAADIIRAADRAGASAQQHHAILKAFAPTSTLSQALQPALAELPRYTSAQIQSIVDAARTANVDPLDISFLVTAADHHPSDYGLPHPSLGPTGLFLVTQQAQRAGVHIDVAARIAATALNDPNDVLTMLDISGYRTTGYTPP